MKALIASILVAGTLLMGASGLKADSTNPWYNNWHEQWFRAKFGRMCPMEEARSQASAVNTVRQGASSQTPAYNWYDTWFRAKFGRPSPTEEARLNAQTGFKEVVTTRIVGAPENERYERWFRAKFGRTPPAK